MSGENIDGIEIDKQVNKKYLKMKANEDKHNYRSPFTGILWPTNTKSFQNPRVLELERDFNIFLNQFQRFYYPDGLVSGFVKESNQKDICLNVGAFKKTEESSENFILSTSYKNFFSAAFAQVDTQKNNTISMRQSSTLTYHITFEFPKIKEKTSFSGQLNISHVKSDFDHHENLQNDYIIEITGTVFEKCDNRLRRKLKTTINELLNAKMGSFVQNNLISKENISKISDDMRKLQAKFIEDEKITQHTLKVHLNVMSQ